MARKSNYENEKKGYHYLGILESNGVMNAEMKELNGVMNAEM